MISLDASPQSAAYRDLNVLRWLAGYALSLLGDQAFFVALSWAATRVASPTGVGVILAAGAVPRALLLLLGGAIADRVGPKRLLVTSDVARTLIMLGLAGVLAAGRPVFGVLVVAAVLFGVVDALFLPAVGALPPYLVGERELGRLQGLRAVVQRATVVLGGPVAGFSITKWGLAGAFGANAALFAASVLVLVMTRVGRVLGSGTTGDSAGAEATGAEANGAEATGAGAQRGTSAGRVFRDVAAGLRYLRGNRSLRAMLVLTAGVEFGFSGPLNTGLPILASQRGWGPQGVGLALGGFGAGAAVAAIGLAVFGRVPRAGLTVLWAVITAGTATAMVGVAPTVLAAMIVCGVVGVAAGLGGAVLGALVLNSTDADHLGRVSGMFNLATFAGTPLSLAMAGLVAGSFGATAAFAVGGGVAVAAAAVGLFTPQLRGEQMPAMHGAGRA